MIVLAVLYNFLSYLTVQTECGWTPCPTWLFKLSADELDLVLGRLEAACVVQYVLRDGVQNLGEKIWMTSRWTKFSTSSLLAKIN